MLADRRSLPSYRAYSCVRVCVILIAASMVLTVAADEHDRGDYDVVYSGGRIIDGSGNPWTLGDVAIRDDRIVAVGELEKRASRRVIDCRGLVIAPGFIDMHSHSDLLLLEDGRALSKITQGVTTDVLGEHTSGGPYKGKLPPKTMERDDGTILRWSSFGEYLAILERSGIAINVVSYVGLNNIWECVMGSDFDRPSVEQFERMHALITEAMDEGAFGLSCMLAAPPGFLATTEDLVAMCRVVKEHGGIFSTHIRNEGTDVFAAIGEAIEVGEKAGVPVDIIHIKIADERNWGRMSEVIALVDTARARGVNVQANVYPYTRGNNMLSSIVPPWAHEGGIEKMLERLADPALRPRIKRDIRDGMPGWYNHYLAVGGDWSRMLVNADLSAANKDFEGVTMDRILAAKSKRGDDLDGLFDFLLEERQVISTIYAHHTEADMNLVMSQPWCSIGSDGAAYATDGPLRRGKPHPRNFGTFPRVLGHYVREQGLLRLEEAVRKMTSANAAKLGLRQRGMLRPGNFADVCVFDPRRVKDRSTYLKPFHYSVGIEYVMVNGELVIDGGQPTGRRPGKALRRGR